MRRQSMNWPKQAVFERWFEKRLERARRFGWSLMVPTGEIGLIEPTLIGGDCVPSPRRLVIEKVDGDSRARLRPEQILRPEPGVDYEALMYEPGDGSVTLSSLLGSQAENPEIPPHEFAPPEVERALLLCERHDSLAGNREFLDSLLTYLLAPDS
jgi:hypothetical protein